MTNLSSLFTRFRNLGVVKTQGEFSLLWGRRPSWFSSSLCRGRQPSLDALARFYVSLKDISTDAVDNARGCHELDEEQLILRGANEVSKVADEIWSEIQMISRT